MEVLSGVPQGSVLGPLAFLIYINHIDELAEIITILRKFADDTKVGQKIQSKHDVQLLQDCLNSLLEWATNWGMEFNIAKCKIMHLGKNNPKLKYFMNGQELKEVEKEKDIGITIHCSLKPSIQCAEAAARANLVLEQISKCFHYRDRHIFKQLYVQHVRSLLEFGVTVWCPWTTADKNILEKVQQRAVNMISGLKGKEYNEKLIELGLQSLETRRKRYDLIETFKILKGITNVNKRSWFSTVSETNNRVTRQSSYHLNLNRKNAKTEVRANFFSVRVPDLWNNLPVDIKKATSVRAFKKEIDNHFKKTGVY